MLVKIFFLFVSKQLCYAVGKYSVFKDKKRKSAILRWAIKLLDIKLTCFQFDNNILFSQLRKKIKIKTPWEVNGL